MGRNDLFRRDKPWGRFRSVRRKRTFPTPQGVISLKYEKDESGELIKTVNGVPDGIEIIE